MNIESNNQAEELIVMHPKELDTDGDTVSDAVPTDDAIILARRKSRSQRKLYRSFIKENKAFWLWFNLIVLFASAGFFAGSYLILDFFGESDCGQMNIVLWAVIVLHAINIFLAMIMLCGLEFKLCNSNFVLALCLFELAVFVWMNASYFQAQNIGGW